MISLSKRNLKIIALIIFVIVISVLVLQLSDLGGDQSEPIKISVGTWPGYGDIFIAQEKGFFEKNNVKVEIVFFQSFAESIDTYNNGQTDGGYTTWPEVITSSFSGINSKVVYVVDISTTGDAIVGLGDSLSDVKGKTIGIGDVDGFSHIFVLKALEISNLNENNVRFRVVLPENVLAELKSGQIAAGHTWEPYKSDAIADGYNILATDAQARIINDVLVFNSEIIKKRPNDIKAVVKSLSEAREYRISHLDESIPIMAQGEKMTNEEMRSGLDGLESFNITDNYKMLTDSNPASLRGTGKFISDFYINIGQLYTTPNFDDLLDSQFVEAIMREN